MKKYLLYVILSLSFSFSFSQSSLIESQLFLNGIIARNIPVKVISTNDNGCLVLSSMDDPSYYVTNCKLVKLDANQNIVWQRSIGGSNEDEAFDIVQTDDGGSIMIGTTRSNDGDVSGNHNLNVPDVWVVKFNDLGIIQWQKCLGSTLLDYGRSIKQTADGGYIIAATSIGNDGDISGHHGNGGNSDYWIVKLNSLGVIQWQKSLGGSNDEQARFAIQTNDGGYLLAGETYSNDGNVTANHGMSDWWVVKLDSTGAIEWQKSYGSTSFDIVGGLQQTRDGYIVAGGTFLNDGNFSSPGYWRFLKLDNFGNIIWNKSLPGNYRSCFSQMKVNPADNTIVVIGSDYSLPNQSANIGLNCLDQDGNFLVKRIFGGTSEDAGISFDFSSNNGLVILGDVKSTDIDITTLPTPIGNFPHTWLAKLSSRVLAVPKVSDINKIVLFPNPVKNFLHIDSEESNQFKITIFDTLGRLVVDTLDYNDKIDLSFLKPGFYLVNLRTPDGGVLTRKILKE